MAVDSACSIQPPIPSLKFVYWHTFGFSINRSGTPDLVPNLVRVIACGVGNLLNNFCYGDFSFSTYRPTRQRLSDGPRDLATFTFNLGAHGACRWYRTSCFICVPSLKFVGLSVRKIWHTFISALICMVTLTFDLLTLKLVRFIVHCPTCIWFYLRNLEAEHLRECFTHAPRATRSPSIMFFLLCNA